MGETKKPVRKPVKPETEPPRFVRVTSLEGRDQAIFLSHVSSVQVRSHSIGSVIYIRAGGETIVVSDKEMVQACLEALGCPELLTPRGDQ